MTIMISEEDRAQIVRIARRYKARRVLLFGSNADPRREGSDIDLAVEGVAPERFFQLYGELLCSVEKPVDLVDLSDRSLFTRLIRKEGVLLYGRPGRSRRR